MSEKAREEAAAAGGGHLHSDHYQRHDGVEDRNSAHHLPTATHVASVCSGRGSPPDRWRVSTNRQRRQQRAYSCSRDYPWGLQL